WEAVVDEVVFVLGPLVVVLCALADPALGLLVALGLGAAGTLAFVAQRATEPAVHPVADGHRSAMASAGLRTLTLSMLCVGVLFGTVEVAMVAFAEERGSTSGAGFLLALVAGGSALAGLLYGALHLTSPLARRYLLSTGFLALGLVPLLLAPSVALMAPAALLAGFAISPTLISAFGLVDELVPVAARTEGFSWLNSGLGVGVALGFAVSGAVADAQSARTAFVVALGGALAAGTVVVVGRRTLRARAGS
ncbi:MAG: major facilitator superfamily 1, partial [Frankiales bacterium]|nr:major facilitator superfamily 1 [Frankiales bacterium]